LEQLQPSESETHLEPIGKLNLGSAESRLWVDVIDESIVKDISRYPEVARFLAGMAGFGEPFTWGITDSGNYFRHLGLEVDRESSSDCFRPSVDPVFDLYKFCVAKNGSSGLEELQTFNKHEVAIL
jgi:hypothetical protein